MKRKIKLLGMTVLAICAASSSHFPCRAADRPAVPPAEQGTVDKEVHTIKLPLGGRGLVVTQPDGQHKTVQVNLKYTLYRGRSWKTAAPQSTARARHYYCYEIESTDNDIPFAWRMWSDEILGRFTLFNTPDGNILTWVHAECIECEVISKGNDKSARFNEFMARGDAPPGAASCPITIVDPDGRLFVDKNTSPYYLSIYVTSAEREGKDGFRIKFTGKDKEKVYTVVTDRSEPSGWRVEDE